MSKKHKKSMNVDHKCKNCLLYNRKKSECRVAILVSGEEVHMPVFPEDNCHFEEMGIEVEQVRWYVEDEKGNPAISGKVKIEYPKDFFGETPNE